MRADVTMIRIKRKHKGEEGARTTLVLGMRIKNIRKKKTENPFDRNYGGHGLIVPESEKRSGMRRHNGE
jgi:hypothetical protein